MSSLSAIRPTAKTWLSLVVLTQVIATLATTIGLATTPLIGMLTATALVLITVITRSLTHASRKLDQIFDEELDSPIQRRTDVRQDTTQS